MGCIADVCQSIPHDDSRSYDGGDSKVKVIRRATGAPCRPCGIKTRNGIGSEGAAHRLAAAEQLPAGLDLEPACIETAGRVSRNLTSEPTTSRPDEESWDFDGNGQDFGEQKNSPKPHANP
jgi:hypothetical protein